MLEAGERAYCSLSWDEGLVSPQDVDEADARIAATTRFWRAWLGRARIPDHRFRDPVQRSALTIKGLTYMPTGATVAALTTSLPETPGGERNWDYRYTWIRDTTFTLQALHMLNLDWEADEFMQFVADVEPTEDGSLQIMYGIDGRRDLTESTRDEMTGYAGARPVRIGNGAFDQRQNDVFGAALDSILLHTRRSQRLPRRLWPIVQTQAECATQGLARARPGDLGGARQAAALRLLEADVLGRARPRGEAGRDPRRRRRAGEVGRGRRARSARTSSRTASTTAASCCQHYGTDALDASTLLAAIFGFLPGDDERLKASVLAIAEELTEDGFVLRYKTDETDDGLSGKEGTFLICSFWLVSALAIVGELQKARDLMERLLRVASPLGLYAEEFDAATGRHLGNFPQAFSHLALMEAAGRIMLPELTAEHLRWIRYDVIIVGTGAGGGTLARHLAPSGKRILLLERGDWLPREPANWLAQDVFVDNRYVSEDTWYDAEGKPFQPQIHYFVGGATKLYGAALYRLRKEDFGELIAPRRPVAGLADLLRRARAVLHAGRAALRGARRARRGPDRAARERALSVPAGLARAADPAALGRPGGRGLPPVPRAVRHPAERVEHAVQRVRALRRTATASPARCTASPTRRCSASGPRSSTRTSSC